MVPRFCASKIETISGPNRNQNKKHHKAFIVEWDLQKPEPLSGSQCTNVPAMLVRNQSVEWAKNEAELAS